MGRRRRGGAFVDGKFANDAYEATATVGPLMSWFQLFGGIIFALAFIGIGIAMLVAKRTFDSSTNAVVTAASCTSIPSGNTTATTCAVTVSFVAGGKTITASGISSNLVVVGQTISIRYSSANPTSIYVGNFPKNLVGSIMIIVGIITLITSIMWFYFIQVNKTVAAASGVGDLAGVAVDGFDGMRGDNNY